MSTVLEMARGIQPRLAELIRWFHAHPEVSGKETETAKRILEELDEIGGYSIRAGVNGCGILADMEGGAPGPKIALRADMDALQITEETGLAFASENHGVMHACGHDNHVTMLLGAARLLSAMRGDISGSVRLIFQPAEELSPVGGAKGMIAAGAIDGVDAVFGLHVWPDLPVGTFGTRPGPLMASSDHFSVHIDGKSSHGAKPNAGIDAVVAGSQFVTALQTIISRNLDPMQSAVISVGRFVSGTRYNIIAEKCELEGTCRTFEPGVREMAERRLNEVLHGICVLSGCNGSLDYEHGYCSVVNDAAQAEYMLNTAAELFGPDSVTVPEQPSMCAEDFAFYLREKPGAFAWLGTALKGQESYPLHNCHFTAPEEILWRGAALFTQIVLGYGR